MFETTPDMTLLDHQMLLVPNLCMGVLRAHPDHGGLRDDLAGQPLHSNQGGFTLDSNLVQNLDLTAFNYVSLVS